MYSMLLSTIGLQFVLSLAASASAWSFHSGALSSSRVVHSRGFRHVTTVSKAKGDDDDEDEPVAKHSGYNVLGTPLSCCCSDVGGSSIGTGFYRNGFCATGDMDQGRHTACILATKEFLAFSKSVGNDLSTPMPEYNFPGLNDGDIWCLCAQRWAQAYNAGKAPQLFLQATHEKTLDFIPLDILRLYAIDSEEANAVLDRLRLDRAQLQKMMDATATEDEESFQ